jgi:sugar lactone lactonase YvrE
MQKPHAAVAVMKRTPLLILLPAVLACPALLGGCAGVYLPDGEPSRAIIKPSLVRLEPAQEQRFKAIVLAGFLKDASKPKSVKWSVNNIPGGNEQLGTIDATGLYRAPAKTPRPSEIHICAEVEGAVNRYLFATVLLGRPSYKLVRSWHESSEDDPHMTKPHGIALDKDGNILIADEKNSQVMRFARDGNFLGFIGSGEGTQPGQFTEPRVVETDADGNVWVSDTKSKGPCLQQFSPDGRLIRAFAKGGTGPGQLLRAHGMDFDWQGRLFVVDVDNFRVNVYSNQGRFLYSWGRRGIKTTEFNAPHGLVIDPSGDVFISNFYGPTQKFDAQGNFLFDFAHGDPIDGPVHFHNAGGDQWGNVYLLVRTQGYGEHLPPDRRDKKVKVVKYNNNGDFITAWSFTESNDRGSTVVVDSNDLVYCLFMNERRAGVQVYAPQ